MKMTPEQKAFYEYGEAVANLSFAQDFLRLKTCDLEKYKDIVSLRLSACKMWNPGEGRDCPNCRHRDLLLKQYPCRDCYKHEDQRLWEPRKEGE